MLLWLTNLGFAGGSAIAAPTTEGLEYTFNDNRLHYSMSENKLHYELPDNKLHYSEKD